MVLRVPGIEIGLAIMLLPGHEGILLVYLCTQVALALSFIGGRLPARWAGRAPKHRRLTLAGVLDLPGNAVIGGAGGIGLIAGTSRLFGFPRYCLLMAAATSPVPILLLHGTLQ